MVKCPRCGFAEAISVREAAERLGVSGQTIRNWVERGHLPAEREAIRGRNTYRLWIHVKALDSKKVQALAENARAVAAVSQRGKALVG